MLFYNIHRLINYQKIYDLKPVLQIIFLLDPIQVNYLVNPLNFLMDNFQYFGKPKIIIKDYRVYFRNHINLLEIHSIW